MANEDTHAQQLLKDIAMASLTEQRRSRRWGIFFKAAFLLYLIFLLVLLFWPAGPSNIGKPHSALIDIKGPIFAGTQNSADKIVTSLRTAFKDKETKGIILRINSPGGSPVQADFIYNEIKRLREKNPDIKVYAACTDVCASGAYYVAAAADDIYADPSSLVGSIGVLMNSFGFVDTLQKVGATRRLITAGNHKGFLDPFSPLKPGEEQYAHKMLGEVHKQFIEKVEAGRGNRLKQNDPTIFSGLIWTGSDAKKLGLIDGFGSPGYVARDVIREKDIVDYSPRPDYLQKFADYFGASFSKQVESFFGLSGSPLQ